MQETSSNESVQIAGAGPAGLAAAVTLSEGGRRAIVSERKPGVGHRFHGDFQGLENWTTAGDVLEELASMGIEATFEHTAFHEGVFFDPAGREHVFRSARPIWYLVRRGPGRGTLDRALEEQAIAKGAVIRYETNLAHMPDGGIVAHGPHRPDAIAAGYVFETDRANGAFAAVSDDLAPKGYSYLLTCNGRGTLASCMFDDFHKERAYVERTLAFFRRHVGVEMKNPRRFGGFGNVVPLERVRKGRMLYVGEAAGFQDALFGFGMRYAILSGHLAARALLTEGPEHYDRLWRERFGGLLKQALVNRFFYERLGNAGYSRMLRRIGGADNVRDWLRRYYNAGRFRVLFYPLARSHAARRAAATVGCDKTCDCTWCRCHRGEMRMSRTSAPRTREARAGD